MTTSGNGPEPRPRLRGVLRRRDLNAVLSWLFVALLLSVVCVSALKGQPLLAGFTAALLALAVVPAAAYRRADAMVPWEILGLASVPALGRFLVIGQTLGGVTLTGRITTYIGVAAAALIVAVELDVFTPVRMSHGFAVLFVSVATVATAGLWAETRWLSDVLLGTGFVLDGRPEHVIEESIMIDFVAATVAGVLTGVFFAYYVRRYLDASRRYPPDLVGVGDD